MAKAYVGASPDFQELKKDPAEMKRFVDNMDNFFGWEQTDMILEVMGNGEVPRPAECPKDPSKRYKAGDPRNQQPPEGEAMEAEVIPTPEATVSVPPAGTGDPMGFDNTNSGDLPPGMGDFQ